MAIIVWKNWRHETVTRVYRVIAWWTGVIMGLLFIGVTLAFAAGYNLFANRGRYRFRVIVEVNTPQGLRTGSSVYEVKARNISPMFTGNARQWGATGEAVAVDYRMGRLCSRF